MPACLYDTYSFKIICTVPDQAVGLQIVSNCCEISTYHNVTLNLQEWLTFPFSPKHNQDYELAITERTSSHCHSCKKFLFHNQAMAISSIIKHNLDLGENYCDICVCVTCKRYITKGKVPPNYNGNSLQLASVPDVLKCLTFSERKLVCKLQILITPGILPGGQFCEKGSVLHLAMNVTQVLQQLPLDPSESDYFTVAYDNGQKTVFSKHRVLLSKSLLL